MTLLPRCYRPALLLFTLHCGAAPKDPHALAEEEATGTEPGGSSMSSDGSTPGGGGDARGETPGAAGNSEELPSNLEPDTTNDGAQDDPDAPPVDCSLATLAPGNHALALEHAGAVRQYLVHVPDGYDASSPVPLVVDMHGLGSSADAQSRFGWREKADFEGFIVVHPQGLNASWNGGELCCGTSQNSGVDDEGFIRALVEQMKRDACIDARRVYATGLSNGGAMSHLLGCNAADVFAAVAPVSMANGAVPCQPSRPISVVMTRSTNDFLVPYDGGFLFPSAAEDFAQWAERSGCSGEPAPSGELCETFEQCEEGVEVALCTLSAGHVPYANAQGFSIPDFVWGVFARQRLP